MTKHLIGLALGFLLLGLAAGCSSDDSGGAAAGQTSLAKAACDKQLADGCDEDSFCEENLLDGRDEAVVFECEAEYTALLECMTQATWMCTVSEHFDGPEACNPQLLAYDDCTPSYGFSSTGSDGCEGGLYIDDVLFSGSCAGNKCSCTDGPNEGTSFNISECQPAAFWGGIKANCR